ncbi:class I adenylate-forming enzyme family protein [Phenylobacterium sp.]|uniref:class I adenylate-forming enzyme family protein n=1 Tax=Phenylobacterium sp. TaxID=1871053 RepID=UPI0030F3FC95
MFERLIAFHANHRPDGLVIASAWDRFTYRQMADDIARCAAWVAELNLPWGSRALIAVPHPYLHWVLTFGLETAGVISATTSPFAPLAADLAFLHAEVLFARDVPEQPVGVPVHRIDQAWLDGLARYPANWAGDRPRRPEDGFRIVTTSGTTGTPKKILLTRGMMDRRVADSAVTQVFAPPNNPRGISEIGVGSLAGIQLAFLMWTRGGTLCHHDPRVPWAQTLAELEIDLMVAAPYHLQVLLRNLPDDHAPKPGLLVGVAGGSISKPLAQACRRRLSPNLILTYGSTETGSVTVGHVDTLEGAEDSAGYLNPWAVVQVFDAQGAILPPGQMGEIRIGGPHVVPGYLDDLAGTQAHFKDGWFYPNDVGVLTDQGRLTVLGRLDDLMNIGGVKLVASQLETHVLKVEGVLDAAAFAAPDEEGLDAPHVAYVSDAGFDPAPLEKIFSTQLGRPARLLRLDEIPRNPLGKVQRTLLRDRVIAAAAAA